MCSSDLSNIIRKRLGNNGERSEEWMRREGGRGRRGRSGEKVKETVEVEREDRYLYEIFSNFLSVEHCVESCDLIDIDGRLSDHFRYLVHGGFRKVELVEMV